jgi:ABC-type branched-subunit amino acid transport system substrate-binding protein
VAFVPVDNPCGADPGPFALLPDQQPAGVLGPFCSNGATVALPALEALGIVAVSPGATRTDLPVFAPGIFNRVILNDDQMAAAGLDAASINSLPSIQAFYEEFESRTGLTLPGDDLLPYVAYAYDAAIVLLQAIGRSAAVQNDGSLTIGRQDLAAAVRGTLDFPGVTGPITIDPSGNRIP